MDNTITNIGNGWYDFSKLDQSQRYIKINALNCTTERKAINRARKILNNKQAQILIKKEG
tara:strand:- start:225 stop:404 length:180 start_codon:yes stop_codon:yes gene_type:complete